MERRRGSRSWDASDRLAAAVGALFVAAGTVSTAAGGPTWLLIVLAAAGLLIVAVQVLVAWRHKRALEEELWRSVIDDPRPLAGLTSADLYSIGVEEEAEASLQLIGERERASYRARDCEVRLREDLAEALERSEATLIVVTGHSKAGKSRIALEALVALGRDGREGWLVLPRSTRPETIAELAALGPPVDGPVVIWLDDLEPWARSDGLSPKTLALLARWPVPVVVLATAYGKGVTAAGHDGVRFQDIFNELIRRAETRGHQHPLASLPTDRELVALREQFGDTVANRIAQEGIGEFMIAARELLRRLEHGGSVEGRAIVRAAIDCRRAGVLDPIPVQWLRTLHRHYLPGPSTEHHFTDGLRWATEPLYKNTALVRRQPHPIATADHDDDTYEPYDFLVAQERTAINPEIWDYVINNAPIEDLYQIGATAFYTGEFAQAEQALRRGDEHNDGRAACNLGVLLQAHGDLEGAEHAYRRADKRGDGPAAHNLGVLLESRGDLNGAEDAYRRADKRGEALSSFNLGVLLQERGDLEGAEHAYRRADKRGNGRAASNLGVLLKQRGDLNGAEDAYRRADKRGEAAAAYNLGVLRQERGDLKGAEDAYRRADERGDGPAACDLGLLLAGRGDREGAEDAYRRADKRGNGPAASNLGFLLESRGDLEGAEDAYRRADKRGEATAAFNLGVLLHKRGDLKGAETAWRRADQRGYSLAAYNLGVLLQERGDVEGARAAFARAEARNAKSPDDA